MITPSGRFQPDRKICFSMSDFHPGTVSGFDSFSSLSSMLIRFLVFVGIVVESGVECGYHVSVHVTAPSTRLLAFPSILPFSNES
jgi:hypothetical protein